MTTSDPAAGKQAQFQSLQNEAQPPCLGRSRSNALGLGLEFVCEEDGTAITTFLGHPALEGFPGRLHNGMVVSMPEEAMTTARSPAVARR